VKLTVLSLEEKLAEIRRLYFHTTRKTIQADLDLALRLLKSMNSEEERERAAVYMEGLAEMRKEWARADAKKAGNRSRRGAGRDKPQTGGKHG
jgi:hypothetical protein